ncbi:MAG: transporter [Flavobacterium psychrophilum]|nr:MAG: transporter [Flavobacterium psychrophilum]
MKLRILTYIGTLVSALSMTAQSNIDNTLASVTKNNKTISANKQAWEARKLEYNTGLTPANPVIEYDYLIGTPANAGNQTDFTVSQSFDFPTAYTRKRKLADEQVKQADFNMISLRQDILLEAKTACIQLVHYNKMNVQLTKRLADAEKLAADFKTKMDKGDGNILDLNKANLQLVEVKKEYQKNLSTISQLNQKLTELNGGEQIIFKDTVYPLLPKIPPFEELEQEYEANDPDRKILEQQKVVAETNLSLSKSMTLPKIEVGYHYQGILGQTYNGVHTGISIPLWENKNVIKQREAEILAADADIDAHKNEHYYHIKHLYENYANLKVTMEAYEAANLDTSARNRVLLNKAFALGQLSSIEYFMEVSYYYTTLNNFLETEKDYYEAVAVLLKYQL